MHPHQKQKVYRLIRCTIGVIALVSILFFSLGFWLNVS